MHKKTFKEYDSDSSHPLYYIIHPQNPWKKRHTEPTSTSNSNSPFFILHPSIPLSTQQQNAAAAAATATAQIIQQRTNETEKSINCEQHIVVLRILYNTYIAFRFSLFPSIIVAFFPAVE